MPLWEDWPGNHWRDQDIDEENSDDEVPGPEDYLQESDPDRSVSEEEVFLQAESSPDQEPTSPHRQPYQYLDWNDEDEEEVEDPEDDPEVRFAQFREMAKYPENPDQVNTNRVANLDRVLQQDDNDSFQ